MQNLQLIVGDGLPFRLVQSPNFIALIKGLQPKLRPMSRESLKKSLYSAFDTMKKNIVDELGKVEYVCATADCWSDGRRAYMGVTAHYLEGPAMERKACAIACRRIKGSQNYEVLTNLMCSIFEEFHITYKLSGVVTDNGSNFCKAFRIYTEGDVSESLAVGAAEEQSEEAQEGVVAGEEGMINLAEAIGDDSAHRLPQHFRCACHTLNLIAANDSMAALSATSGQTVLMAAWSRRFKTAYRRVMGTLTKLWKMQNTSTRMADKVKEELGRYLLVPNQTRWNSTFDALEVVGTLLRKKKAAFTRLLAYDNLSLTAEDHTFIMQFVACYRPFAQALDVLQGEEHAYWGYLLPVLARVRERLEKTLERPGTQLVRPLAKALLAGLEKRFASSWEDKNALIAAAYVPSFKLGNTTWPWLPAGRRDALRTMLMDEMTEVMQFEF